jgi:hypothetical protein
MTETLKAVLPFTANIYIVPIKSTILAVVPNSDFLWEFPSGQIVSESRNHFFLVGLYSADSEYIFGVFVGNSPNGSGTFTAGPYSRRYDSRLANKDADIFVLDDEDKAIVFFLKLSDGSTRNFVAKDESDHLKFEIKPESPENCTQCWNKNDVVHNTWPARDIYSKVGIADIHPEEPFSFNVDTQKCELKCKDGYWSNSEV